MLTSDKKAFADFLGMLSKLDIKERDRVLKAIQNFDYSTIRNVTGKELEKIISKSKLSISDTFTSTYTCRLCGTS